MSGLRVPISRWLLIQPLSIFIATVRTPGKSHPQIQLLHVPIVNAFDELQVMSIVVKLNRLLGKVAHLVRASVLAFEEEFK
jgi:hypothetical protein